MQFDVDLNGPFTDTFLKVREIVLSFEGVREQKNAKQTAYYDTYSAICFLRSNEEKLTISLAKGSTLQESYPFLKGEGKIARHIYLRDVSEVDESLLRAIIEETMVLNMEAYELRKLRCNSRGK